MNKSRISLFLFLVIVSLLSACKGASGLSAEDQAATAAVMAATIIQQTADAAIPTATETALPSLTPTATEELTATPTEVPTEAVTNTPAFVTPTATQTPFLAAYMETPLKFTNQTKEKVTFKFTSPIEEEFDASGSVSMKVPFGTYYYVAWVGEAGPFSGSIDVHGYDKIEIWFREDRVKIVYP